jgi:threonine dehydratase
MTPLEQYDKLAEKIGSPNIFFKREDLHKFGSHKGRSIPYMIDYYYNKGDRKFAISSSGNAALAGAKYLDQFNSANTDKISLDIFVGHNVNENKLKKLKVLENENSSNLRVLTKERPVQALTQAVENGYRSLRQSTDDIALLGYESLGKEITKEIDKGAIFIGTSSGTTAQALAQFFLDNKINIQVHIVQTSSCHPISDQFENYDGPQEKSIADAIVAMTTERMPKLVDLINKTGGYAWTATNEDIGTAIELVQNNTGLAISNNSALSVAGLMQVIYRDWQFDGKIICLICGE